jgi:hypothetical protein
MPSPNFHFCFSNNLEAGATNYDSSGNQSSLKTGIKVEKVDNLRLFKFTEQLQTRLEELLEINKTGALTPEEEAEPNAIGELDRIFTYLNSLSTRFWLLSNDR